MLHFNKLELHNFGPYKGTQVVDFTRESGVTIFWGNNGRGKTTLLNAFRYVLFGVIKRRSGNLKCLRDIENEEASAEGDYGFHVKLYMTNDSDKYELTRQFVKRANVTVPNGDEDYVKEYFLKKNGSILSNDDCIHELNLIMPEQIARFFLFDGELLQEYEDLLDEDSTTGEQIKKSIEKILGMPVLQNGVIDVEDCLSQYRTEMTRAVSKDDKSKQYVSNLEEIESQINEHDNIIKVLYARLDDYQKQKAVLENRMSQTEKLRNWLNQQKSQKRELKSAETDLEQAMIEYRETMKDAWRGMLSTNIRDIREELERQIKELDSKKQKRGVAEKFIVEMKKAIRERVCPVCGQDVESDVIKELQRKIDDNSSEYKGLSEEESEALYNLQAQLAGVKSLSVNDSRGTLKVLESRIEKLQLRIGELVQSIKEVEEDIKRSGSSEEETAIEQIAKDYSDIGYQIKQTKSGIDAERKKINELNTNRDKLLKSLNSLSVGVDCKVAQKRYDLCNQLFNIFDESKTRYRELLKENVESDATELFVQLTGDKDYVGLQINDNYGLSIKHRSGRLVPGRSSGYEHVVALSLIGALHKNAPLNGPIIIDSPSGRLDKIHTMNMVRALPSMAEQSMLLAYVGEIDEQDARKELKNHLLKEYTLRRVSSMHTEIE